MDCSAFARFMSRGACLYREIIPSSILSAILFERLYIHGYQFSTQDRRLSEWPILTFLWSVNLSLKADDIIYSFIRILWIQLLFISDRSFTNVPIPFLARIVRNSLLQIPSGLNISVRCPTRHART